MAGFLFSKIDDNTPLTMFLTYGIICAVNTYSSVLRGIVAYALQDGFYGSPLSKDAAARLADTNDTPVRQFAAERGVGAGARLVRFWQGARHEAVIRDDGRFEYNGKTYNSLSAVAKAITGTHWNGKLFFGVK